MKLVYFCVLTLFIISCSVIRPAKQITDNQKVINTQEKKVDKTLEGIEKNDVNTKTYVSIMAAGTQYSLNQVTNPPIAVLTAKALNERLISIVGIPILDELHRIQLIVDLLNSEISEDRKKGEKLLAEKDVIITALQKEKALLQTRYENELYTMTEKAKQVAKTADENQATMDTMGGMFGLNAVFWGLKKFFFSCLTIIVTFVIVFIVLRFLSTINPIAATAFSIFNLIGSFALSTIKSLTPRAIEMSKLVNLNEHVKYKNTLDKIVDKIEELKRQGKLLNKDYTLTEILTEFEKTFDSTDKECIEEMLKNQKWI